jgi:hypothetical protein
MVIAAPKTLWLNLDASKKKMGMLPEQIGKMEEEMQMLERDMKSIEGAYRDNMMDLTLARAYLRKLLENAKVARYLKVNYPDILTELERTAAAEGI